MKEKRVVIIVPFTSLNDYVVSCVAGIGSLRYGNYHPVLLPDAAIDLPHPAAGTTVIPTGRVTIGRKRNIAIERFPDADYYACIDSDAFPHPDWLSAAVRAFARSEDIWVVGGPSLSPPSEPFSQRVAGNALKSFLVSGLDSFCKKISKDRYCAALHSCNMVIKRRAAEAAGGFDETLLIGEDQAFCNRVRSRGGKIYYDGSVIVYHRNRPFARQFLLQRFLYGFSSLGVVAREKSRFSACYLVPTLVLFLFVLAGWALRPVSTALFHAWCAVTAAVAVQALVDAVRYSATVREMPATFAAILSGIAAYGAGNAWAVLGADVNVRELYVNHERRHG